MYVVAFETNAGKSFIMLEAHKTIKAAKKYAEYRKRLDVQLNLEQHNYRIYKLEEVR